MAKMILFEIKEYFDQVEEATLMEVSRQFHRDPKTMRNMLQHWVRKGVIRQAEKPAGCGVKCVQCPSAYAEVYERVSDQ